MTSETDRITRLEAQAESARSMNALQFKHIDERFDKVDQEFQKIDTKLKEQSWWSKALFLAIITGFGSYFIKWVLEGGMAGVGS